MVRDLYMFSEIDKEAEVVWFKITYENTVHSEADITSFFAENGLDIRFAYLDSSEDPSKGKYVMFTEVGKNKDIKSIADKLGKMDVVLNLDWGFSKNRAIQTVEFPVHLLGERAIIIRVKTFVNILNIINENAPQSEGLLTMIGLKSGTGVVQYFRNMVDVNDNNFLDLLKELFMASGWGILDYEMNTVDKTGTLRVTDSFIADEYEGSDVPKCAYMSGFLAGYISESLHTTVQVRETICKSMGNAYCEHQVSPAPKDVKVEHLHKGELY